MEGSNGFRHAKVSSVKMGDIDVVVTVPANRIAVFVNLKAVLDVTQTEARKLAEAINQVLEVEP